MAQQLYWALSDVYITLKQLSAAVGLNRIQRVAQQLYIVLKSHENINLQAAGASAV